MRILAAAIVPSLLLLAACGSPFLSAIEADTGEPVEASAESGAPDRHVGAHHEAGADRDAGDPREAGRRDRDAPEGGADVVVELDAAPDVSALDAQADVAVADAAPEAATVLDAGPGEASAPDSATPDAGCAPPAIYANACGATSADQFCVYDGYTYSTSIGSMPPECQCAATFTCACLVYWAASPCGSGSYSGCSVTGGVPEVTCD